MPSEMETCINCNQESDGNYCPNCGQKLHLKKLTLRYISSEFTDRWLGLDTKFTRSAWGLFLHPEQVITAYLNRNNVRYIGPLGYYIVMRNAEANRKFLEIHPEMFSCKASCRSLPEP